MPDYSSQIAALELILDSGTRSTTTDGLAVTYDLDAIRRRLAELRAAHDGDPDTDAPARRRQKLVPYRF